MTVVFVSGMGGFGGEPLLISAGFEILLTVSFVDWDDPFSFGVSLIFSLIFGLDEVSSFLMLDAGGDATVVAALLVVADPLETTVSFELGDFVAAVVSFASGVASLVLTVSFV